MAAKKKLVAKWYDGAHPPETPGLYYWETCTSDGYPCPGLYLWEEGKPPQFPTVPSKYFGPIPGAFKEWPMVPLKNEGESDGTATAEQGRRVD